MSLNLFKSCSKETRNRIVSLFLALGFAALGAGLFIFDAAASGAEPSVSAAANSTLESASPFAPSTDDSFGASSGQFELTPSSTVPEENRSRAPAPLQAPAVKPVRPGHEDETMTEAEKIQLKLSSRYGNPVVGRFIQNMSVESVVQLYKEIGGLIDSRHIEPATYQERTRHALVNLMYGVDNREFLAANRLSLSPSQVANYRESLRQMANGRSVRSSNDAINIMYATINLSREQINLRPTTVALEFVYGATESLDKYSAFEPEEPARKPSASNGLEDHVVGIGVEIKPNAAGVLVVNPLAGGPAAAGGVKPGDVIISINGQSLEGKSLDFAADLIAGQEGSRVLLGIRRGEEKLAPVTLVRRRVEIHSVSEARMIEDSNNVGYIKLDKFAQTSSEEMDRALWELYGQGMTALIIDVRGNPGGLLTTAIEISDKFLPAGAIVSTHGRNPQDESAEYAKYDRTWKLPLVVLVDEMSASASEIFAAAIQENGRGVIVGRLSYGKGTVQTHFPLKSVTGNLRLTTAKFYSPTGHAMAGVGVTPDILVKASDKAEYGFVIDEDIRTGVEAVHSDRAEKMAQSQSGRRNPGVQDLPL